MTMLKSFGLKCQILKELGKFETRVRVETIESGFRFTVANEHLRFPKTGGPLIVVFVTDASSRIPHVYVDARVNGQKTCLRVKEDQIVQL